MRQYTLDYREIGKRIRQRRHEMKLTQEALAELVGISASFVGHIERGEKPASTQTFSRLCAVMDASLDYFISGIQYHCDKQKCGLYEDLSALLKQYGI